MDLNDIQQLYHYVIKIKRTFITIGRNSMLIGITENKKQLQKTKSRKAFQLKILEKRLIANFNRCSNMLHSISQKSNWARISFSQYNQVIRW